MNNNNNGGDKDSLTGSGTANTTVNWPSNNGSRQTEGIISNRTQSMMIASSPAGVFKPPMTVADQRLMSSGRHRTLMWAVQH
jgi:hypothetical protein